MNGDECTSEHDAYRILSAVVEGRKRTIFRIGVYMCIACESVSVYVYASVLRSMSKRQATNCNKISMYNIEYVCSRCIRIGVLCVRVCVSSWCCILYYNNGINIWFTFIHY